MFNVRNVRFYILFLVMVGLMGSPSHTFADSIDTLLIGVVSLDEILAENAPDVVANVAAGSQEQTNFRAILLHDVYTELDSTIYDISNGQIFSRTVEKVDVGSAEALSTFIIKARAEHSANREVLTLIGHGVTPLPDISWDGVSDSPIHVEYQPSTGYKPAPMSIIMTTPIVDPITGEEIERGYDFLSTPEMGDFLSLATDGGEDPFDILWFDRCFDGSLDALYEVKDAADIFIASPNYAWAAYSYDQFVPAMATGTSNADIADEIITDYQAVLNDDHPNSIFWIKGDDIGTLANYVSEMGAMLTDFLQSGAITPSQINRLQAKLRYVDTDLNTDLDAPDEYATLHSLATALKTLNHSTITRQANYILSQLSQIGRQHRAGHPHINPDVKWAFNNNDTITVIAPLQRSNPAASIWRSYLYADPTISLSIEAEDHQITGEVLRPLAYAQAGSWDDFIAYWYPNVSEIEIDPWVLAAPNTVSESLFDFEENTQWAYHYSNLGATAIVNETMEIAYTDMQENAYVAFHSQAIPTTYWLPYHTLSVDVKGTNSGNEIQLYFEGYGHGRSTHTFTDDFIGWQTVTMDIPDGYHTAREIGMQILTEYGGATTGKLTIDNVQLIGDNDTRTMFDFSAGERRWDYHYSSIGQTKIVDGIMEIRYWNVSPYQYFAHHSGAIPVPEWGEHNSISLSVKGNNSGNEIMLYVESHTTGHGYYTFTDTFTEWREMVIPLDEIHSSGGRPTNIHRIGFQIFNVTNTPSSGVLEIDNIMINK